VVVVVGSFGKTTTTRVVAKALGLPGERHSGWNSGVFVATQLLRVPPWSRYAVLEVAIRGPGQMKPYAEFIQPDIVVVTGIGSEHGTSLRTLENTREEKANMVRALPPSGLAVLNGDDSNVLWMRGCTMARVVTYGFGEHNDVRADEPELALPEGMRFDVAIDGTRYEASTRLIGRHMAYPVLVAASVARELGIDAPTALSRVAALPQAPERLEIVRTEIGAFLLVDTQKSQLETIESALQTLTEVSGRRKIVVLGEVEEPPGSQGPIYRELGERLAHIAFHVVFVGGRRQLSPLRSGAVKAGLPRGSLQAAGRSARRAAELVGEILQPGDVVLIKGRSNQKLVRVALALQNHNIGCDASYCDQKPGCRSCDRLLAPGQT